MSNARLRTKTGCITCRNRRVKCGEEKPQCRNCSVRDSQCIWPTTRELSDRRHRHARHHRPSPRSLSPDGASSALSRESSPNTTSYITNLSLSHPSIGSKLELELTYHMLNVFHPVLVLPTWDRSHLMKYHFELVSMLLEYRSVKWAVLASAASNKHALTNNIRYHKAALEYYSRGVEDVKRAIGELCFDQNVPSMSLITTVIYLYIYDLWGQDTALDPRGHVAGAVKLLNLRYDKSLPLVMTRPFDRLTTESVIYQAFLLSIRRPFAPNFHIDSQLLFRSEAILDTKALINAADQSSPVLGVSVSLYRLILEIIDIRNLPAEEITADAVRQLRTRMKRWEALVLDTGTSSSHLRMQVQAATPDPFQKSIMTLYILAASLLLDWTITVLSARHLCVNVLSAYSEDKDALHPSGLSSWQVERALPLLRQPNCFETWSRCFLGVWPLSIFGYAVVNDEDISLLRHVLRQAYQRTGYGEIGRVLDELETAWKEGIHLHSH